MKLVLILLLTASSAYPFAYDSAIYKAQKGNWQDAHATLTTIITDNPDKADAMYDAGVAAYNVGNKCQATTCFARAAECSGDKNMCVRAYFNAGNTYVDEKKLEDALAAFNKALAIEPTNEYVRHNRDRVVEMLKKQEQNDKDKQNKDQQNDQDKKEDQEKDKQENKDQRDGDNQDQNQDGNDQQSSDGNDQQNSGQKNQSGNDKQSSQGNKQKSDASNDESLDQQSQQDQGDEAAERGDKAQRKEHRNNKKEQQTNSGNDGKRDGKNELDKPSQTAQNERGDEQTDNKHDATPGKQNISEDKSNVSPGDGQEQAIDDPWLLSILKNQEVHDKAINKQLMESKIRQHGGKNGQNCW